MNKIIAKHNPDRPLLENVLEFVKDFIIKNDGILYGGQAIEYTLRKYGMKLYDDDESPDYDFYAKNNVDLAYKLSEELREKNIEVDVIHAIHPQTMRVRVVWNFVADISYLPNFEIPTIVYNGIKLIHPKILLMGQHLSLSFPYYGPPKEAIFQRFFKDLERYNLIYSISSITKEKGGELNYTKTLSEIHGLIHCLPAYGIYLREFQKINKMFEFQRILSTFAKPNPIWKDKKRQLAELLINRLDIPINKKNNYLSSFELCGINYSKYRELIISIYKDI